MIMNRKDAIRNSLLTLSEREERVIRMRYGIDGVGVHTLEEVGQEFCVTRERIRQIEIKALQKLASTTRNLREFV